MVPSQENDNEANGTFWLRANDCELIYDIKYSPENEENEDGAHFYGPASDTTNAGVAHTLKAGSVKQGVWNFCKDGASADDLLDGKYYSVIYFDGGDVRTQITFETENVGDRCPQV